MLLQETFWLSYHGLRRWGSPEPDVLSGKFLKQYRKIATSIVFVATAAFLSSAKATS